MSKRQNNWFEVDKVGLSKILTRRGGKSFILYELLQNAWDEKPSEVHVVFKWEKGISYLDVIDDSPDGFENLRDAFTLFAESKKKSNPELRGRFDIGEKLVLACCQKASIISTKGAVLFNQDGTRKTSLNKTEKGTTFNAEIKMTKNEFEEASEAIFELIPPSHILTTFNTHPLEVRKPVCEFEASLKTEISDNEGNLRPTTRKTKVRIYSVEHDETPKLYEMGIPIVETNDKFHYEIMQKVPLNTDRDNVPPSYLNNLRTLVLNKVYDLLDKDDASEAWVNKATESDEITEQAINNVMKLKFGDKRVIYDPSDPEANGIAMSKGMTVIPGRSLNKHQWKQVKKFNAALPAGKVTPSPKPYSPDGKELKIIPEEKWSDAVRILATYCKTIAKELIGKNIHVIIANDFGLNANATFGSSGTLVFNVIRLGWSFFNNFPNNRNEVNRLLIHELGHHYSTNHLSSDYHDSLCHLGSKMTELALSKSYLFCEPEIKV